METVGTRELKTHLSRYLRAVQNGVHLVVTDRGRPVARLTPLGSSPVWDQLVDAGLLTPGDSDRPAPEPVTSAGGVSDLVGEQRGL